MDGNKSYKVGEEIYEIPEGESESFLKDFPKAVEIQSFIADKDTFDIPIEEVKDFQKEFPSATPLKKKETLEPKQKEFYTPPTTLQEQIASPFGEKPKESVSEAPSTPSEQLKPVGGLEYKFQTEQPGQRIPGSKAFDTRTIQEVRDSGEKPTMDNYIYSAVNHLEQFGMEGVEGIKSGYEKIKKGAEIFKEGQDVVLQETAKTIVAPYIGERGDFSKIGEGLTKQAQGYVKMIAGTGEAGLSAVMHFTPSGAVVTEGIKAVELIPGASNVTKFLFAPVSSFAELKVEEVARQSGVDPEELKQEVISGTTADLLQIGDFIGAALFLKGGHEGYKGIREKIKQGVDLTPQEMNEAISASLDVVKDPDLLQKASDLSGLKIKTGAQMDAEIKANKESLPENKVISAVEQKIKGEDSQKELAGTNVDKETFDTVVNLAKTTDQITENQATELTNEFDNVQRAKGSTPEEHQNNPEIITLVAEKNKLQDQKKGLDESFHPEINAKIDEIKKKIQDITTPKTLEIKSTEEAIIPEKTALTPEEITALTPEQKDDYEFAVEFGDTEAIKKIVAEIKPVETVKEQILKANEEFGNEPEKLGKKVSEILKGSEATHKKVGDEVIWKGEKRPIKAITKMNGENKYEIDLGKGKTIWTNDMALESEAKKAIPKKQEITHPQTVEFISEGFPYKEGKEPIPKRKTLDKVYRQEHIDFTNEMIDTGLFNSVGEILTWRPDLGISTVEVKAGIKAIKEGRNTAPARKLIEASKEIMDKGEISMIIGSGGMMDKMGVTLDDWRESVKDMPMPTELTEEQAKQAENLPQNVIDIISKEGITKENFVSLQDELKGWYSEKELNQIKTYFDETTGSKTTGAARTGAAKVEGKPLGEAKGKGKTRPTEEELVKKLEAQKKKITDRINEEKKNLRNNLYAGIPVNAIEPISKIAYLHASKTYLEFEKFLIESGILEKFNLKIDEIRGVIKNIYDSVSKFYGKEKVGSTEGFPDVIINTSLAKLKSSEFYKRAKNGSIIDAIKLVNENIKDEKIKDLAKKHPNAELVAINAEEVGGTNLIPAAMAEAISQKTGLEVNSDITQINKVGHTGADAVTRIMNVPLFVGEVIKGKEYILLDDVVTSGSSFSALKRYIESRGGKVVDAIAMATTNDPQAGYGGHFGIKTDILKELNKKFGKVEINSLLLRYGIAEDGAHITNSQGKYLLTFRSLESIRDRFDSVEDQEGKNYVQKLSEAEGPSYGITQFNPNEVAEKKSKIKTKKGEEIPLTSLSQQGSFDFAGESFVQQEANKAVGYSSELKPDENIWMERLLSEHPNISLTAGTKIKTSADVAYLFRHLEDAVSENVFAVLKKKDGSYDVLYLGTGGTTGAVVDIKFIYTAAKDRGAESVYIVHNHPSGNLKPSAADIDLHTRLKDLFEEGGIKVNEGIIINLDSGDYTVFSKEHDLRKERPKAMPGETSVKTYHFEKQRLYAPSAERTKIFGSEDIAVFLSQQKRGLVPKNGIIILDRANTINRYLLEGELTKQELIDKILENVGRHGESVILVTNGKFDVKMINEVGALLKKGDIQLLDAIETTDSPDIRRNYKSLADEGFLREPEKSYGKESTAGEAKAIKEYDAAISDFDQKIINAKKSKQNKLNQFSKRVDLFGAEAKTNELFGAEQDLSKENIDKQMQPYNDEIKKLEKEKSDFIDNKERFLKKYEGQTEIGIKAESAKKRITEIGEKIKKLPGVTGPEGLTKAGISPDMAKLIDVTVKTIHKLIDAGVEIGEAIDRAIATMKRSGIYKRLSGEKDFNIDEFDNQIRTEFEKEKPENRIIQEEAEKASEQTGLNPAKIDKAVKEQKRKTVEEARGFIKKRRAAIDSENFKTAIYTHGLEKELTKEQREVLPFIIEGTSVPEKLGRPDLEKVYESDKEKLQKYADDVKKHFDDMWQKIVENTDNLSNEQIKDYVTHIWDIPKSKIDGVVSWFSTKNRFLKKRYIATLEEGINTFGLKPKVLDIADIIKIHDSVANTVIANSEFVKDLKTLERDGVPLMVRSDKAPEGWVTIDHPSLTAPLFIPGETPTIVRLPYKVHPDLAGPLKAIFDKKIDHPVFKAWTALDSVMKKIALSISLFHHGALTETAIPQMGIYKTGKTIIKDAILKAIRDKADSTPLLDYPEETLDAINHGVKFGHTLDIDTGRIKTMLGKVAEKTKDAPVLKRITGFLDSFNDKWDNVLWNYLHDGLKLQAFMDAKAKMPENVKNPKVYLEEQAQLINDYFGGQNWDNLLVSPKTQQLLSVFLLSPDWTISKLRLAGAPFGIGKLSKEGRFARAKTSGMFWFKSAMYYGIGINLLNAYYRSQDEKEHPEYYPKGGTDFMDKTMFGNTIGHKTHLFTGRYEDGSEKYLRWGKEFREVPELFMDEEGISFPRPLLKKIGGKMSPMMQLSSQLLTGKTLSGYENWDLKDKKGWDWTLGAMKLIGKSFLPFSSGNFFRDDKQWSPSDLMFPSSKGMSNSAAIGLFKKGIEARDEAYVKEIYENAVRNNLDAYGLFKIALQTIKAEKTRELTGDVKTIQDINQKLKTATIEEKIKLSRKKQKLIIKKQNTDRANLLYNEALAKMREFEATKR